MSEPEVVASCSPAPLSLANAEELLGFAPHMATFERLKNERFGITRPENIETEPIENWNAVSIADIEHIQCAVASSCAGASFFARHLSGLRDVLCNDRIVNASVVAETSAELHFLRIDVLVAGVWRSFKTLDPLEVRLVVCDIMNASADGSV